uniref:Uncharacterized protein n=1 Tax=Salix viminalis TaxID=40686 RepID=A0A6N2N5U6_SALVM
MSLAIRIKHEEQTSSTDLRDRFLDSLRSLRRLWKGIKQLKEEENSSYGLREFVLDAKQLFVP